jgi:hypothetical protein
MQNISDRGPFSGAYMTGDGTLQIRRQVATVGQDDNDIPDIGV